MKKRGWRLIAAALLIFALAALTFGCGSSGDTTEGSSAKVLLEVIHLPHPPLDPVLANIDKVVAGRKDIEVRKVSFDDPAAEALIKKYKLEGHIPVAIFINGRDHFTVDGRKVIFRNFPKGNSFTPSGFGGDWNYDDLRKVLARELKAPAKR